MKVEVYDSENNFQNISDLTEIEIEKLIEVYGYSVKNITNINKE